MVNINRLQTALKERGISYEVAAKALGVDRATFYRRIAKQGSTFTVREVGVLAELLNLPGHEMQAIFFDRQLA